MSVDAAKSTQHRPGAGRASGRLSLAEEAYIRLEEMIVTLDLQPGGVFSESDLSRKVRIGRTPLREAACGSFR